MAYDVYSRPETLAAGNGMTTDYGYNVRGLLESISHRTSGAVDVLSLTYALNGVSNVTGRTETGLLAGLDEAYAYDDLDQLVGVDVNLLPDETFAYGSTGNRTGDINGTAYTYDALMNRLTGMGGTTFAYDLSGNRTSRTDGAAGTSYAWSPLNQLTQVSHSPSGDTADYRYDALGRRTERTHTVVGSGTTTDTWVYDGFDLIENARNGALRHAYVHGPGIDNPLALLDYSAGPVQAYYFHSDRLGSIRALTDSTESVVQSYTYTSFGVTTVSNPSGLDQPFRYTAREWDDPAGLYQYRFRWYDPDTGQFISHDPIRWAGGINLYGYVNNDALNWTDPLGLESVGYTDDGFHTTFYTDYNDDGNGTSYSYSNSKYDGTSSSGLTGPGRMTMGSGPIPSSATMKDVSPEQFGAAQDFAQKKTGDPGTYHAPFGTCRAFCKTAMEKAGQEGPPLIPPKEDEEGEGGNDGGGGGGPCSSGGAESS